MSERSEQHSYKHEHTEDPRKVFDTAAAMARHLSNAHGHEVHPTWPQPHMATVHEVAHELEAGAVA